MAPRSDQATVSTRDRLVAAAVELFAEHGFEATTVGQIEAAVGLVPRRGSLYKHFESKEALLHAAAEARTARAAAFLEEATRTFGTDLEALDTDDLHSLIVDFGRRFLAELDDHRQLTRIVEHDGPRVESLRTAIRAEVITPGHRAVARVLTLLAPEGTDAAAHAALLLAALTGLRRTAWTFGPAAYRLADHRALDAWARQCLAVLRPPDPTSSPGRTNTR